MQPIVEQEKVQRPKQQQVLAEQQVEQAAKKEQLKYGMPGAVINQHPGMYGDNSPLHHRCITGDVLFPKNSSKYLTSKSKLDI
ncbi:hypothetical protein [Kluyvera sichuanensis]|uniref:hypothetical protein n=1 Tax=Kluyvera sichuanensis TaxID=2725494 RepID=UPI0039F5F4C5